MDWCGVVTRRRDGGASAGTRLLRALLRAFPALWIALPRALPCAFPALHSLTHLTHSPTLSQLNCKIEHLFWSAYYNQHFNDQNTKTT